jgi:prolyl-tRNA synthetase
VGPRDLATGKVVVVRRFDGSKAPVPVGDAVATAVAALESDQQALHDEAKTRMEERTEDVKTLANAIEAAGVGFARIPWAKVGTAGEDRANEVGLTVRCLTRADGTVPDSEDESDLIAYIARSY